MFLLLPVRLCFCCSFVRLSAMKHCNIVPSISHAHVWSGTSLMHREIMAGCPFLPAATEDYVWLVSIVDRTLDLQSVGHVFDWVLVCWWWRFDWSFDRLIAPVVTITSTILSSNKIHSGDILVLAYLGPPGKMAIKMERETGIFESDQILSTCATGMVLNCHFWPRMHDVTVWAWATKIDTVIYIGEGSFGSTKGCGHLGQNSPLMLTHVDRFGKFTSKLGSKLTRMMSGRSLWVDCCGPLQGLWWNILFYLLSHCWRFLVYDILTALLFRKLITYNDI